jgi:hypothetical protein
MRPESSPSRR